MSALGLIRRLDRQRFQPLVLLQKSEGALASFFREAGIPTEPAPPTPQTGPIDLSLAGQTDIYLDPALSERVNVTRLGPWRDEPAARRRRRRSG